MVTNIQLQNLCLMLTDMGFSGYDAAALCDILLEKKKAVTQHGDFHSTHEGYGVVKEEFEELWEAIKNNDADAMRSEGKQLGAMAWQLLSYIIQQEA